MKIVRVLTLSFILATSLGSGFFAFAGKNHPVPCAQYLKNKRLQQKQNLSELKGLSRRERPAYAWASRALLANEFRRLSDEGFFSKNRFTRFLSPLYAVATGSLPHKADRPFPEELLNKIKEEGILPHLEEIKTAFQSTQQKQVENYRTLQKSARALYFIIYATVSYAHVHHLIQDQREIDKENLFQTLKNFDQGLDRLEDIIDQKKSH